MTVAMFLELPGATTEQYDRLNEAMGIRGPDDEPDGLLSHVCAEVEGRLMIFDVWRSQEDLDDFLKNQVGPAAEKLGVPGSPPRVGSAHYQLGAGSLGGTRG